MVLFYFILLPIDITPSDRHFASLFRYLGLKSILLNRWNGRLMNENEISKLVVTAAIETHRTLGGPGLLESVYEEALAYELT